jgi:plasmid stabilization system protein ParE
MFKLRWTDRGRREFLAALAFIAEDNPANALLVKERTYRTITNLEAFSLGLPAPHGTFKIYIQKTSYFLIFRRDKQGDITLCAFIHSSRDWEQIDWENV